MLEIVFSHKVYWSLRGYLKGSDIYWAVDSMMACSSRSASIVGSSLSASSHPDSPPEVPQQPPVRLVPKPELYLGCTISKLPWPEAMCIPQALELCTCGWLDSSSEQQRPFFHARSFVRCTSTGTVANLHVLRLTLFPLPPRVPKPLILSNTSSSRTLPS